MGAGMIYLSLYDGVRVIAMAPVDSFVSLEEMAVWKRSYGAGLTARFEVVEATNDEPIR